jgi:hypothetical protein
MAPVAKCAEKLALAGALVLLAGTAVAACSSDPKGTSTRDEDPTLMPSMPGPAGSGTGGVSGGAPTPGGPLPGGSTAPPTNMTMDSGMPGMTMKDAAPADAAPVDAGPPVPTECADGDAGFADEDAGPLDCIVVGDVKLQYRASDTNPADNQIKPHFNLVNGGKESVSLAELKIRYWFADNGTTPLVFWCDYAQIGCGSVRGAFANNDRTGGNRVLEVTFSGGTLAPGAATGEIQTRLNHEDWALFNESDDWSFDPTKTAFTDWHKVTLYRRGQLVWGLEPK